MTGTGGSQLAMLRGEGEVPHVREATLIEHLRSQVREHPGTLAVEGVSGRLTFEELWRFSLQLARLVREAGVHEGDRVVIHCANRHAAEFFVGVLGVVAAGGIAVPVNTRLADPEMARICDSAEPRAVLTDGREHAFDRWARGREQRVPVLRIPELHRLVSAFEPAEPCDVGLLQDAVIMYTSGTTGIPKGATFNHRALSWVGDRMEQGVIGPAVGIDALAPGEIIQTAVPLYTSSGILHVLLPVVYTGATGHIEEPFDAAASLRLAVDRKTDVYFAVPTMLTLMRQILGAERLPPPPFRCCFFGGAPIPVATVRHLEKHLPQTALVNIYSLTETGAAMVLNHGRTLSEHPEAAGRPLAPAEVGVMREDGQIASLGTSGIVAFRGPGMMCRYFRDPRLTTETISDEGWLYSGDIGEIRPDELLYLRGRKHDMIVRGGFNVYPDEVEYVLEQHPGVIEAAVVGKRHPVLGEDLVAFVVPSGKTINVEELRSFCLERLADYKVPRDVRIVREDLPRNPHGKLVREALRERSDQGSR